MFSLKGEGYSKNQPPLCFSDYCDPLTPKLIGEQILVSSFSSPFKLAMRMQCCIKESTSS